MGSSPGSWSTTSSFSKSTLTLKGSSEAQQLHLRGAGGGGFFAQAEVGRCAVSRIPSEHCRGTSEQGTKAPLGPNVKLVQGYVLAAINKQNTYSMVSSLLTETMLLKFDQQVKCATRGTKTLDQVHSNIKMDTERPLSPVCS